MDSLDMNCNVQIVGMSPLNNLTPNRDSSGETRVVLVLGAQIGRNYKILKHQV
jgi:hypothetical protein